MSTRSRIGVMRGENVESVYCHSDGYPSYTGRLLLENYTDPVKVDALMALGDLSLLGAEIGEPHNFDTAHADRRAGIIPESWTLAYGRDRGEHNVESVTHPIFSWPDSDQEFEYLFTDTGWHFREPAARDYFRPLNAAEVS